MHLDEEQIQRILHAELTAAAGDAVRRHLTGCSTCRSLVDEARLEESRIFGLLRELDHPLPRIPDDAVSVRVRRGPIWGRLAAAMVLGIIGAGAAYAASGGPLPAVFQRLIEWVAQNPSPKQPSQPALDLEASGPGRGIALSAGDRLVILFSPPQTGGLATISLTDNTEVEVRTVRGQASFTSDLDRLRVDSRSDSIRFQVLIPRRAPWVEVQVGGRRVFLNQSGRVVTQALPDARGDYPIPLNW
jgi:hypothetical protein